MTSIIQYLTSSLVFEINYQLLMLRSCLLYQSSSLKVCSMCWLDKVLILTFLKRLLNVKESIKYRIVSLFCELRHVPLYITRVVRLIQYWCKLWSSDNILLKTMYIVCLDKWCKHWVDNVTNILWPYELADIVQWNVEYNLKGCSIVHKHVLSHFNKIQVEITLMLFYNLNIFVQTLVMYHIWTYSVS